MTDSFLEWYTCRMWQVYLFKLGNNMKECKKCGIKKEFSSFYKHKQMGDGFLSFCKACVKLRVTSHREENIDRIRAYDRVRGDLPHRVEARKEYAKTEASKESKRKASRKWSLNNHMKRKSHDIVSRALKSGILEKSPCDVCGGTKSEAHHENYYEPLNVTWLCDKHHKQIHKDKRESDRNSV